jgi:glutamyl-tRNA reductase
MQADDNHNHSLEPMRWQMVVVGVNHETATVAERRPLQISPGRMAEFQLRLSQSSDVMESAILATCNRVEFYLVTAQSVDPFLIINRLYCELGCGFDVTARPHFYILTERDAISHLFRVAAGIDSMVLGENQILGQVKDAFSSACQLRTVGRVLQRAFHQAFRIGKQIRTETEMGRGICSVSSAAVDLLRSRLADFERPDILFVGAGRMISLAASRVSGLPVGQLHFANRTQERAEALATAYGFRGHSLSDLPDLLVTADIAISCTGSEELVITSAMLDRVSRRRAGRPLLLLDLAMPPDIEYEPERYRSIQICNLDDIKEFVSRNQERRAAELPKAELLIEQRLAEYMYWYTHVHREADREQLSQALERVRRQELERVLAKLPFELRTELTDASRNLVEKVLQVQARLSETGSK